MNLYSEVYKIQDTELKKDEKEAFIHFLWNLWSILSLAKFTREEKILELVKEVYKWYIKDWCFRRALVELAQKTENWDTNNLKKLPDFYYKKYFDELFKIKEQVVKSFLEVN